MSAPEPFTARGNTAREVKAPRARATSTCSCCGTHYKIDPDFVHECETEENGFPYVQVHALIGGVPEPDVVLSREEQLEKELTRVGACGHTILKLWNYESNVDEYTSINCNKWFCPQCGGKGGHVHHKRMRGAFDRFKQIGDFTQHYLKQWVFTVPIQYRDMIATRKGMNSLMGAAKRAVLKYYPDRGVVGYLHLFGEDGRTFHPHVNVHVIEPNDGALRMISAETLAAIKDTWVRALRGLGMKDITMADVHYSFKVGALKCWHAVKYMSRPTESIVQGRVSFDRLCFLVLDMKGFRYIRYWGKLANNKYKDECMKEDMKEIERVLGPGRRKVVGIMSREEFNMLHKVGVDIEMVKPGFWRDIKQDDLKNKKKRRRS